MKDRDINPCYLEHSYLNLWQEVAKVAQVWPKIAILQKYVLVKICKI